MKHNKIKCSIIEQNVKARKQNVRARKHENLKLNPKIDHEWGIENNKIIGMFHFKRTRSGLISNALASFTCVSQ